MSTPALDPDSVPAKPPHRRAWPAMLLVLAAAVTAAVGLLAFGSTHPGRGDAEAERAGPPIEANFAQDQLSGLRATFQRDIFRGWKTNFHKRIVPLYEFERGGPPPDGIPPLYRPRVTSLAAGDRFLASNEPVVAVVVRGHARAYPYQILIWHEVVNDVLGGRPILVTYCPLCNSALAFDRRVGRATLRFGTTGDLRYSDLVMWDRRTQSWWQQITGRALMGAYAGARLRPIEAQTLSWAEFKARYRRGDVLSRHTGFKRPYGVNPYLGYDHPGTTPFLFNGNADARLPTMARVAAVRVGHDTVVVPFSRLAEEPVAETRLGGTPAVVLYDHDVASALDASFIRDSPDTGDAGAFDRRVRGRTLDFAPRGDGTFRDTQTGSTWDVTGRATAGPLRGAQLRPLAHDDQFWFALAAFFPRARVLR